MMFSNGCGAYCEPESAMISSKDRKALLTEKAAILEAKLATIRHWIEESDEESEKK